MDSGPFKIVRCSDLAIADPVGPAALAYTTTRDFAKIKDAFTDGVKPTIFHARPLTLGERREVRNKASDSDRYEAAFTRGIVKIENLEQPDGERRDYTRPQDHSGKDKPIPDADLADLFDEATVQEIGMVIYSRSFLARTHGHYFPLPGISQSALAASLFHRAVRMNDSSKSASGSPPAAAPPATPPTSSPDGDATTAATATV